MAGIRLNNSLINKLLKDRYPNRMEAERNSEISEPTWTRIRRGDPINPQTLAKLARHLDRMPDELTMSNDAKDLLLTYYSLFDVMEISSKFLIPSFVEDGDFLDKLILISRALKSKDNRSNQFRFLEALNIVMDRLRHCTSFAIEERILSDIEFKSAFDDICQLCKEWLTESGVLDALIDEPSRLIASKFHHALLKSGQSYYSDYNFTKDIVDRLTARLIHSASLLARKSIEAANVIGLRKTNRSVIDSCYIIFQSDDAVLIQQAIEDFFTMAKQGQEDVAINFLVEVARDYENADAAQYLASYPGIRPHIEKKGRESDYGNLVARGYLFHTIAKYYLWQIISNNDRSTSTLNEAINALEKSAYFYKKASPEMRHSVGHIESGYAVLAITRHQYVQALRYIHTAEKIYKECSDLNMVISMQELRNGVTSEDRNVIKKAMRTYLGFT